uniref:Putative secreted protein n=1 Tax=Anopheles triannulatus TaxID=58253 RepID=A0A2M4B6V1_9DIPT
MHLHTMLALSVLSADACGRTGKSNFSSNATLLGVCFCKVEFERCRKGKEANDVARIVGPSDGERDRQLAKGVFQG